MMGPAAIESAEILVDLAFQEDLRDGNDVTSESLIPEDSIGTAQIVARGHGVACGMDLIQLVVQRFAAEVTVQLLVSDGSTISPGASAAILDGRTIDILKTERTVLNFLGRLSGIATLTEQFVKQITGTQANIYDTRKTMPGWRNLEKHAVICGGGRNHRMGLYDAVLIKDNHLAAISSFTNEAASWLERIKQAIAKIRNDHPDITVQVEVDTLQQLEKVILLRPDLILLDNMSLEDMKTAVAIRGGLEIELEASGGIDLQTVRAIAETGVERISVGALTHSAINFDWGLDWQT